VSEPSEPDPAEDRIVRSRARRQEALAEEAIPKLPRGRGFRVSSSDLLKIGLTAGVLVMLIAVQRPCADRVSSFVVDFDHGSGSAKVQMPKPDTVQPAEPDYELLHPNMSEAELKAAIERAKQRAGSGK
jgi:hypothetical protein